MAGSKAAAPVRRLRCATCGLLKDPTEFHRRSNRHRGRMSKCRVCESERQRTRRDGNSSYHRQHYEANRERYIEQYLLRTYGITQAQYDEMWRLQGGLCACCGRPERTLSKRGELRALAVDHDHRCCPGKTSCGNCIRGLLCHACNTGLGSFEDNLDLLAKAAAYLDRCESTRSVQGG